MQPPIYFLNRMSELQHMKRHRVGLWADTGQSTERGDPGQRAPGESWISHTAPGPSSEGTGFVTWSFFIWSRWNVPETWGELRYMQVAALYMHVLCLVHVCEYITTLWITHQASSFILQRPPQQPLSFSKQSFFFFSLSVRPAWCQGARWFRFQFK